MHCPVYERQSRVDSLFATLDWGVSEIKSHLSASHAANTHLAGHVLDSTSYHKSLVLYDRILSCLRWDIASGGSLSYPITPWNFSGDRG